MYWPYSRRPEVITDWLVDPDQAKRSLLQVSSLLIASFAVCTLQSSGSESRSSSETIIGTDVSLERVVLPETGKPIKLDAKYTVFSEPQTPKAPVNLKEAVTFAEINYPLLLKSKAQLAASVENVTVQKLSEYMPDSLFQYQEFFASHNQLTSVFYGSPVFPGISGPGFNNVSMSPMFSANGGFSLDWAPIDFGLHKARIDATKLQASQAKHSYAATRIDIETATATSFLDVTLAAEQVYAAQENVRAFEKFDDIVQAQITGALKPAADGFLSRAQLANARNDLIRARLSYDVAVTRLATAMGVGGKIIAVECHGLANTDEPADLQNGPPVFSEVPLVKVARLALLTDIQSKKILDKEYFPVLHFIGGANIRGAGLSPLTGVRSGGQPGAGTVPVRPNYQMALILNWNFLDIFRLKAEKKVQIERIHQQQQDYYLVLQNLRGRDAEARATVKAAVELAENMPIQVQSASIAVQLAETRYTTGLGSVAQVAESAQVLANARVKQAAARIGVWRALLEIAYVHGNLQPFLEEADRVQRGSS